jgi:hypothetical protein
VQVVFRYIEPKHLGGTVEMTFADGWLLLKKILLGIAITVVPLAIIAGGLWSIQPVRADHAPTKSNSSR